MEEEFEKKLNEPSLEEGKSAVEPRRAGSRLVIGAVVIVIIVIATVLFGGPFSRSLRGSLLSSEERGRDEITLKAQTVEVYPDNRIRVEKVGRGVVMGKWKIASHDNKKEKKQFEITEIGFDLAYATDNPPVLGNTGYRATIGAGERGDVEVVSTVLADAHFDGFCETIPLESPFLLDVQETELQLTVSPVDFSNVAFHPIVCIKGRTSFTAPGHAITVSVPEPEIKPENPPLPQFIRFSSDTLIPYADVIQVGSPEGASCTGNAECISGDCLGLDNGARGKALMFDGVDDFVVVGRRDDLDIPRDMTIAAWVKFSDTDASSYRFIYKRSGNYGVALSNIVDSGKLEFTIVGKEPNSARGIFARAKSARDYNDNAWHLMVGTYDGAEARLYIDGALESSTPTPEPITVFYQHPYSAIGKPGNEGSTPTVRRHWKGGIDEVRIYNRALTTEEVSGLFGHAAPAGALLYYSFDSVVNGIAADESGNGQTGSVLGAQFPPGQCSAPVVPPLLVIEDDNATLHLFGKNHQAIQYPYTVTPNTKISFGYQSDAEGVFQGIGIDGDENWAPVYFFELYGTQPVGDQSEHNYADSAPGFKQYDIPLGQLYQGDIRFVTFVNSPADGGSAESRFKNVLIYEEAPPPAPAPPAPVEGQNEENVEAPEPAPPPALEEGQNENNAAPPAE